jgi:hypothetical protein
VAYQFDNYSRYYFVFTNDGLARITLPPRFEHELSPWERGKRATWKSNEPGERIEVVLQALDLDREALAATIEHSVKLNQQPKGMDNALPAAGIVGVIGAPVIAPRKAVERSEIRKLAAQFNPYRVRLGTTLSEVEQMFGQPHRVEQMEDHSETRYYGSPKFGVQLSPFWVAVSFEKERVVSVFSDDFFNFHKVENTGATRK